MFICPPKLKTSGDDEHEILVTKHKTTFNRPYSGAKTASLIN